MLRRALRTGRTQLRPQTTVTQVNYTGRRATGVSFIDAAGNAGGESADIVVLACSAVLSPRLALLSNLPDPYARIGKRIMFQNFYDGFAIFLNQRVHAYRGRRARSGVRLQRSRLPRSSSLRAARRSALYPCRTV